MQRAGALVKTAGSRTVSVLRRAGTVLLDQLYPPVCIHCSAPVASHDGLCGPCFARLRPITEPLCARLGLPFAVPIGPDALSAEAIANPPPFERARSAVLYNELARALVSRLKYGDHPELARFCARLMAASGRNLWAEGPLLVPVPLHRTRQFTRRYNQSIELARALATETGLKVDPLLVRRVKRTRQQVGLTASQRATNVAGAFLAHPDTLGRLKGRNVVLVDDVITTGATVEAITRVLRKAGVNKIDVISFARVVIGAELTI